MYDSYYGDMNPVLPKYIPPKNESLQTTSASICPG